MSLFYESSSIDCNRFTMFGEFEGFMDGTVEVVRADGKTFFRATVGIEDNDVPFIFATIQSNGGARGSTG